MHPMIQQLVESPSAALMMYDFISFSHHCEVFWPVLFFFNNLAPVQLWFVGICLSTALLRSHFNQVEVRTLTGPFQHFNSFLFSSHLFHQHLKFFN